MVSVPPPLPPTYKDRRTGLVVFGILVILLGAFFALSAPATLLGVLLGPRGAGPTLTWTQALTSMILMLGYAAALIWVGIGSIKARRWAQALLHAGGWVGLVFGVAACAMLPWMLPSIRAGLEQQPGMEQLPPGFLPIMLVVIGVVTGFFYLVIPGAILLFYRSPHVRRTCQVRDPVARWTDDCPVPVLAAVLVLGYGAFALLSVLPQYGRAFLFFGSIVTGIPAMLLWLVVTVCLVGATRGFARLDVRAWWIAIGMMIFFGGNSLVSFRTLSLLDYYRAAGMSAEQVRVMEQFDFWRGEVFWWTLLASSLLLLGYLVYVRRFFAPAGLTRP